MSNPAGARGGYAKGDARREEILDAATGVFDAVGYRAATMLQIAAACGISRTGLLHHFASKESLLAAVLTRRDERDAPADLAAYAEPDEDRARLAQLIEVKRHNAETPGLVHLFSVLSAEAGEPDHPAHEYFVQRYAELRADLQQVARRLDARGQLVAGTDPDALVIELIALMDGLQVQWLLAPDQVDMPGVLRHRIDAALRRPLTTTS